MGENMNTNVLAKIRNHIFWKLSVFGIFNGLSDKHYLEMMYYIKMGKKLNLKSPQTYNEKLQWLKLYDRRPEYTIMVDKHKVKSFVAEKIGKQYVIPTIGVWETFEDIDFEKLPERFVLKCTHDSGGLVICKNKSTLDIKQARTKINSCLKRNYFFQNREWPYKNVKPRIIAEQYMEDSADEELRDYKFFAFNGVVRALFIATERENPLEKTKFDFFDENFIHLDFTNGKPNSDILPHRPQQFEKMKELAGILSQGIPQVRIDFYEVNGKVYFGEITFFHWSGMKPFVPKKWDYIFGKWIELSEGQE